MNLLLSFQGCETLVVTLGQATVEATHGYPDAAVLDIGMPDLDRYAVARALRRQHGDTRTVGAGTPSPAGARTAPGASPPPLALIIT